MAAYGLAAVAAQPHTRLVFDDHNAEYLLQKRSALVDLGKPLRCPAAFYSLIQWQKLQRYEQMICRRADAVVAVSEPDRSALLRLAPDGLIDVVPNGIDLADFPFAQPVAPPQKPPTLVFTGKMDYRPNVDAILWFAQDVLPLIQARQPDVRLQVVGMNPHPRLAAVNGLPGVGDHRRGGRCAALHRQRCDLRGSPAGRGRHPLQSTGSTCQRQAVGQHRAGGGGARRTGWPRVADRR
jgi:glycosyltransferase involved in cell wall biosynthesis